MDNDTSVKYYLQTSRYVACCPCRLHKYSNGILYFYGNRTESNSQKPTRLGWCDYSYANDRQHELEEITQEEAFEWIMTHP